MCEPFRVSHIEQKDINNIILPIINITFWNIKILKMQFNDKNMIFVNNQINPRSGKFALLLRLK